MAIDRAIVSTSMYWQESNISIESYSLVVDAGWDNSAI